MNLKVINNRYLNDGSYRISDAGSSVSLHTDLTCGLSSSICSITDIRAYLR